MDALATPFGRDYRYPRLSFGNSDIFYGMPVGEVHAQSALLNPDISPFVLNNHVVIDGEFYDRLVTSPNPAYSKVSDFYRKANEHGFLKLEDFESVLSSSKKNLDLMLGLDMEDIESWVPRMVESLEIWEGIMSQSETLTSQLLDDLDGRRQWTTGDVTIHHFSGRLIHNARLWLHGEPNNPVEAYREREEVNLFKALLFKSHRRSFSQKAALKHLISARMAYVNANIILSRHFSATIYDWSDMFPFYDKKFNQIGCPSPQNEDSKSNLSQLFSLLFPSDSLTDYDHFFSVLQHKRISELRELCGNAASGKIEFDDSFAASVWREQLGWRNRRDRFSKRISWWAFPLNFIPVAGTALSKSAELIAETIADKVAPEPYPWVMQFSDIYEGDPTKPDNKNSMESNG